MKTPPRSSRSSSPGPSPSRSSPAGSSRRAPNQRARNQRGWLVVSGLAAVLAMAGAVVWVLLGSSLFEARAVQVIGTRELPADEVRAAAAVPLGVPVLRLDIGEIEARVATLPWVAAVRVSRGFEGTVWVMVTERTPIAVRSAPDGLHLVDVTGLDYAKVADAPPGMPELLVDHIGPEDDATIAAIAVLTGLPEPLRARVRSVAAGSPAEILLRLDDEREVRWGGVEAGDRKAAVLSVLLTQPGEIYDVSSPDLPTIS